MRNTPSKKPSNMFTRNALVICMAFVTGCTNTAPYTQQGSYVKKETGDSSGSKTVSADAKKVENKYNLPDLGLEDKKTDQKSVKKNSFLDGTAAPAEQQLTANPNNRGYGDAADLQAMAVGLANSEASDSVKDWFGKKHMTAELSLGAGESGIRTGSFDLLVPLVDKEKDLFFTQVGVRRSNQLTKDYRNTVNIGVGYRHTLEEWMLGVNSFYDRDTTGGNDRLGLGVEAWKDFLKLSGNSYIRLSDWKKSNDLEHYYERPANGWDLRAEAYLPQYPQLGGKLIYEQYYGDDVGLFGYNNRQKDPSAATVGLTYTPIPLITLGTDYRQGQNGISETSVKLGLNLQLGVSLKKQLSPDELRSSRMISNARYNLVSRNNEIVLDYKKEASGTITLPNEIKGTPNTIVNFPIAVTGTLRNITWTGTGGSYANVYGGGPTGSLKLPAYVTNGVNTYTLVAVATDVFGKAVQSNSMRIGVEAFQLAVESTKTTSLADGTDFIVFTTTLKNPNGTAVSNADITWTLQGTATIVEQDTKTDSTGKAKLKLTSTSVNDVTVTAREAQGSTATSQVSFIAVPVTAKVTGVVASTASVIANGTSSSTLTATVTNANGQPAVGAVVTWAATVGTLSTASSTTDANGKATTTISSVNLGQSTITATAEKGSATQTVNFVADITNAKVNNVTATPSMILADNTESSTLVATLLDDNNHNVGAGVTVTWSTSLGTLSSSTSVTDANGKATVTIKGTVSGTGTVTASTAKGSSTTNITFNSSAANAVVVGVISSVGSLVADNTTEVELTATVNDSNGNIVPTGTQVNWTTTGGTLSVASSVTDANGNAKVRLKSALIGQFTVTATAAKGSSATNVTFIANVASAKVINVAASSQAIPADNLTETTLTATVEDANGNKLPAGVTVTWSSNIGTFASATSVTDANGKATNTFKSLVAGTANIVASAIQGSSNINVTVNVFEKSLVSTVTATPNSILADGIETSSITAKIVDQNGVAISNKNVSWSTTLGTLSTTATQSDVNGLTTVTLTGLIAGSATVTATSADGSGTATVTIVDSPAASAKVSNITSTADNILADGITETTLTATVVDKNNNPVPAGITVNWTTTKGILSATSSVTDSSGNTSITLKSTQTGALTVSANSVAGGTSKVVNFIPDGAVIDRAFTSAPTVNQEDTITLYAAVVDNHGNPAAAGIDVTIQAGYDQDFPSNASGVQSSYYAVTNNEGIASVTFTGKNPGKMVVYALVSSDPSKYVVGGKFEIINDTPTLYQVRQLFSSLPSVPKDGSISTVITSEVVLNGLIDKAPAGVRVTWTVENGILGQSTSVTDSNGDITNTVKSDGTASQIHVIVNLENYPASYIRDIYIDVYDTSPLE